MSAAYCSFSGKVSHSSQNDAARALKAQGNHGSVYRCDICHGWHVSKASPDTLARARLNGQPRKLT
jgi:hypothetical protein